MRDRLLIEARDEARAQNSEREKLATRIEAIENQLQTLGTQPASDAEALQALQGTLSDTQRSIETLSERVALLEKKPEPVAVVTPPTPPAASAPAASNALVALTLAASTGKPYARELAEWNRLHPDGHPSTAELAALAESGIPSEADVNRALRAALDDAMRTPPVDDVSTVGKINTHMAGLVSIKKATDTSPYDALRTSALRDDSASLIRMVEALDDSTRKPLEPWLKNAVARRDALAALAALTNTQGL